MYATIDTLMSTNSMAAAIWPIYVYVRGFFFHSQTTLD